MTLKVDNCILLWQSGVKIEDILIYCLHGKLLCSLKKMSWRRWEYCSYVFIFYRQKYLNMTDCRMTTEKRSLLISFLTRRNILRLCVQWEVSFFFFFFSIILTPHLQKWMMLWTLTSPSFFHSSYLSKNMTNIWQRKFGWPKAGSMND